MEPAHPAISRGPGVPREWQGLHSTSGKLDKVLLQRSNAERVGDFVFLILSIRILRRDDERITARKKPRFSTEIIKLSIVEVTKNGRFVGYLHGEFVV